MLLKRAFVRRVLEEAFPPKVRFLLFRVALYLFPSRVGAHGFLRLADALSEEGLKCEEMHCWRILHDMAPADSKIAARRAVRALDTGELAEFERVLDDTASRGGFPPQALINFAGMLAEAGHMVCAGRTISRLAASCDADRLLAQSPSILSHDFPLSLGDFAAALSDESRCSSESLLQLARLCFAFQNPAIAIKLFERASLNVSLSCLDRVALQYSLAEVSDDSSQGAAHELNDLIGSISDNPPALGMLVKVALVAGELSSAKRALRLALQGYLDAPKASEILEECDLIVDVLLQLREIKSDIPRLLMERPEKVEAGIDKVFLCGFGWSGSGALYDDIRGFSGFSEFEGAGCDTIINQDADSEVTFVQGPGGFGSLWAAAVQRGEISWNELWNTFSLHVAGVAYVGYSQYKSSAAARRHLCLYGADYVRPFRVFMEKYLEMRRAPVRGALHGALQEATESLCQMLLSRTGGKAVLFNNAVFGRNVVMLEVFRSPRAAVVYRDPRDVYVDRRNSDLNHWRTPNQLAAFYADGLKKYVSYRLGARHEVGSVREVPFERFVKNVNFRSRVRAWLLGGVGGECTKGYFEPALSVRNIGIHVGSISESEIEQLEGALKRSRDLDKLADASWVGV